MIFLKKFYATGFKSFANKTTFNFKQHMAGVVGPNGSGKSNIVDAIKWVLGEKSNKQLRGKTSEDVIFHGSKGHEKANYAEVTLVFDNKNKILHTDLEEVSITRRIERGNGNNLYFINNEPARLRDIQLMFLDSGLSKGSLGIISQGTVQWFVDAKPEERRTIFEEAAGIGLYKKQKDESLSKLANVTDNLNRVTDLVNEIESQVKKLQKQAEKAKLYQEKKNTLMKLDLSIIVKDLKHYEEQFNKFNKDLISNEQQIEEFNPELVNTEESLKFANKKFNEIDQNLTWLNDEFKNIIEKESNLNLKKQALDHQIELDLTSENLTKKINAYASLVKTSEFDYQQNKNNAEKMKNEVNAFNSIIIEIKKRFSSLNSSIISLNNQLNQKRYELNNNKEILAKKNHLEIGVKTIIDNQQALSGVCGLVSDFFSVEDQYEKAISTALGKSTNHIIVETNTDAINAINFLKQNQSGKATFLPLDSIKPRNVRQEHFEVIKTIDGFINIASNIISFDAKYENIYRHLLANVIIADDLRNASKISSYSYNLYRVITLDGDVINAGGSMTGGFNKKNFFNFQEIKNKIELLNDQIIDLETKTSQQQIEAEQLSNQLEEMTNKVNEKNILLNRYQDQEAQAKAAYEQNLANWQALKQKNDQEDNLLTNNVNQIDQELILIRNRKDKINQDININQKNKLMYRSQIDDKQAKYQELRVHIDKLRTQKNLAENNKIKAENAINMAKEKINVSYKMTLEYAFDNYQEELPISESEARNMIKQLQNEIDRLGSINMEAMNELEEKQKRYDELVGQQKEIQKAYDDIMFGINEMDKKAIEDFDKTIKQVNDHLPEVFKYLFGGGSCHVEYTNEEDILNSGIDILANPPGKNIVHLNLLSGGEKTLVALSILFAILKIKNFPLIILDEAESALDPANVERFANIINESANETQFIVITHRSGTMEKCHTLFGATMQTKGVTSIFNVSIKDAQNDFSSERQE